MGGQYGSYIMYFLSQLLEKQRQMEKRKQPAETGAEKAPGGRTEETEEYFTCDETAAQWHKEKDVELLKQFCREGYAQAKKHGHFIIGTGKTGGFIGIPGRFLIEEQPAGGATGFTLWQPLKGGEALYESLDEMDEKAALQIYGYWIAAIDSRTLKVSEV